MTNSIGMRMLHIPAGTFRMGALNTEPDCPGGTRGGLVGRRYATDELTVPNGHFVLDSTDVDWGDAFGPVWSARCWGRLQPPTSGKVRFRLLFPGGVRVRAAGQIVLDCWRPDRYTLGSILDGSLVHTFTLTGTNAEPWELSLELRYTGNAPATFRLTWEWDGHPAAPVPDDALEPMPNRHGWRPLTHLGASPLSPMETTTNVPPTASQSVTPSACPKHR